MLPMVPFSMWALTLDDIVSYTERKKVEPKWHLSGAIFMSTGWPPFRSCFSTFAKWYRRLG